MPHWIGGDTVVTFRARYLHIPSAHLQMKREHACVA